MSVQLLNPKRLECDCGGLARSCLKQTATNQLATLEEAQGSEASSSSLAQARGSILWRMCAGKCVCVCVCVCV